MNTVSTRLFNQFSIGSKKLSNRLAVAPMTRVSATDRGNANANIGKYYKRFAKGGFGLIITEGLYTDNEYSQGYLYQPGMSDDEHARSWAEITKSLQVDDSKVFAQIMHSGALSQGNRFRTGSLGPSSVKPKGSQMSFYYGKDDYAMPTQISDRQIADVIETFATAAKRAIEISGFDGIELHGANGYLLDQFITDYTNKREDRWGGPVSNRIQIVLEVLKAVKSAVGQNIPVGVRISQAKVNDNDHKWLEAEAGADAIFGSLASSGADYIHVTEYEAWQPAFPGGTQSLASLARKYAPNTPVIANGKLHSVERALQVLDQGADIIALGKGALANPDWPKLAWSSSAFREFDPSILGPIANVKESELNFE